MRASDVVVQLALSLPQLTDKLTDDIVVNSIVRSGSVMTANCDAAHGLEPGDRVAIVGAVEPIPISSLTRSGTTGTLVTSTDHDLTEPVASTVTISGATESEFNGTFTRTSILNRSTIIFEMADAGPTTATGSPVLEGAESALRQYDSSYAVLEAPSKVAFTFAHAATTLPDPIGTIVARAKARVSASATIERALAAYTKQAIDKLWAFVVIEDVVASKNRAIGSDALENLQPGHEFRQQLIQPFTVYTVTPTADQLSGMVARDQAEDLFRSICQSLLGHRFDSGLQVAATQGTVAFVSHGTFAYNTSIYVHAYSFQQVVDLVFEDTVGPALDVAFRDIALTMTPDLPGAQGLGTMTAAIDLDESP